MLPVQKHKDFRPAELFSGVYGKRTLTLGLLWFTGYFVVYGYSVWLPSLYVQVGGLAPSSSVLLTIMIGLIVIAMNYVTAWLVERIGRKKTLVIGFGLAAFGGLYGLFCVGILGDTSWPILFSTGCLIALGITVPAAHSTSTRASSTRPGCEDSRRRRRAASPGWPAWCPRSSSVRFSIPAAQPRSSVCSVALLFSARS